jgi:hypothetical protein
MSYHQRTRSDSPILAGGGSRRISLPAQEACDSPKPISPISDIGLCKPSRQSQISEQYEVLNKNLAVLSDLVSALESKFDPVLRPEPGNEGACAEKEAEALAPLAAALRERNRQLQNLNARIAKINSRNEL